MVFRKLSFKALYQFDIETTTFSLGSSTLKIQINSKRWIEDGRKLPLLPEINLKFWLFSRGQAVSWDDRDGILYNFQTVNGGPRSDYSTKARRGMEVFYNVAREVPPHQVYVFGLHPLDPSSNQTWLAGEVPHEWKVDGRIICKSWIFHCLVWDTKGYTMVYQLVPGGRITLGPIIVPSEFKNMWWFAL